MGQHLDEDEVFLKVVCNLQSASYCLVQLLPGATLLSWLFLVTYSQIVVACPAEGSGVHYVSRVYMIPRHTCTGVWLVTYTSYKNV